MKFFRLLAAFATLALLCFVRPVVAAESPGVALLLGDIDSATAVEAVRLLKSDPALRGVRFSVFPASDLRSRDLRPLRRAAGCG